MFVLPGVVKQQWGRRDRGQIGLRLPGSNDHAVSDSWHVSRDNRGYVVLNCRYLLRIQTFGRRKTSCHR